MHSDITRANVFFLSLSLSKVPTRTANAMKKSQRNASEKGKGRRRGVGRNAKSLKEEKITRIFAPFRVQKEVEHKKKKIDDEDEDEVVEEDEDEQQKTTKERKKATVVATGEDVHLCFINSHQMGPRFQVRARRGICSNFKRERRSLRDK